MAGQNGYRYRSPAFTGVFMYFNYSNEKGSTFQGLQILKQRACYAPELQTTTSPHRSLSYTSRMTQGTKSQLDAVKSPMSLSWSDNEFAALYHSQCLARL